jgi:hypothetical protein
MYLGRHVVRRSNRTLFPVAGSIVRARTMTPWQIAPTGRSRLQNSATLARSTSLPRYWRIPGAWPPGSTRPSYRAGSISAQAIGARNSGEAASRS